MQVSISLVHSINFKRITYGDTTWTELTIVSGVDPDVYQTDKIILFDNGVAAITLPQLAQPAPANDRRATA